MPADTLRFTVVVPTLGHPRRLTALLDALGSQTLDRSRWDLVVSFDGADPPPEIAGRLAAMAATAVSNRERRGPGAARNAALARATGDYLAFTEDDCVPSSDWLALAAQRLERDPGIDVLEGATVLPDGRPARRRDAGELTFLPTNLIVLRSFFERIGGYCEQFFDPERGVYFREDSDFGFTALEQGGRVAYDPALRVEHPEEHPGWLDPIRWAERYEMDPLLAKRHPAAFRERIEIARVGPFRVRRPFVRACAGFIIAAGVALILALQGEPGLAAWFAALAGALLLVVWSKWRFDPRRIVLAPVVPFVLVAAILRGRRRTSLAQRGRTP